MKKQPQWQPWLASVIIIIIVDPSARGGQFEWQKCCCNLKKFKTVQCTHSRGILGIVGKQPSKRQTTTMNSSDRRWLMSPRSSCSLYFVPEQLHIPTRLGKVRFYDSFSKAGRQPERYFSRSSSIYCCRLLLYLKLLNNGAANVISMYLRGLFASVTYPEWGSTDRSSLLLHRIC